MALLDRYKKSGGFLQLLILLESSTPPKREKFLTLIAAESPAWEKGLREKILTLERIAGWNSNALMEALSRVPSLALAMAITPLPQVQRDIFLGALEYKERKQVEAYLDERSPSPSEILASELRIITDIRGLFANGTLKYDKIDPSLAMDDDIELQLNIQFSEGAPIMAKKIASEPNTSADETVQLRRQVAELTAEVTRLKEMLASYKKIA